MTASPPAPVAPSATSWVARLAVPLAATLDPLRLLPGLEGRLTGAWIWVKGGPLTDAQQALYATVPWHNRFSSAAEGWLFESDQALPWGKLPEGPWRPLAELLVPLAPPSSFPGELRNRALLEIQRSDLATPAALLMLPAADWYEYAHSAPALRLERLSFVLNEAQGQVLVCGEPLPPLPGRRYYFHGPAAIPCGHAPFPALQPSTLASWLRLAEGETALFDEDGTYARISADLWQPASRSAIRANCAPLKR
jgi:hypothetical protein